MDNPEDAFAETAQERAILARTRSAEEQGIYEVYSHSRSDIIEEIRSVDDENSPLITDRNDSRRRVSHIRGKSYDRAINEPWTGAHGSADAPWYKKPSVYWLLPAFFPFCVAFGGILVPKTYLIQDLICRDLFSDRAAKDPNFTFAPVIVGAGNDQCGEDDQVQSKTAIFNLYSSLLSGLFGALVAPQLGALSDRIGRKKVIIFSSMGALLAELLTIIVGTNADSLSVYWILLGYLADGLCGSFTTSLALCFAYASDCSKPERRNVAFGHFHATLFAGIAIGPILAGLVIKATNNIMIPFYVALGCHIYFMLTTALFIPESLSKERQLLAKEKYEQTASERSFWDIFKVHNILRPLWVLRPVGEGSSPKLRRNLLALASIDTMMFGVAMGTMQIILLYARKRFQWTPVQASGFLSIVNVARVLCLLIVLPALTRIFRGRHTGASSGHRGADKLDIAIIRGTVLLDLIGYIGYAGTPSGAIMVLSGMIAAIGGIGPPTLQSALTKHMPADRTGQMLGASGLLHALARVVAPAVFNLIYSKTVKIYAGIVFVCLASIFVVVFVITWFLKPNVYFREAGLSDAPDVDVAEHDD